MIDGVTYDENPRDWVGSEWLDVVRLYRLCGWGGMGPGLLPDAGGINAQAAWLMDAFLIVGDQDEKRRKAREEQ